MGKTILVVYPQMQHIPPSTLSNASTSPVCHKRLLSRRRTTAVTRPRFEIADIIRRADSHITSRYREFLTWAQVKVLNAILRCRTAALGGHRDQCTRCGYQAISYNSCLMGSFS